MTALVHRVPDCRRQFGYVDNASNHNRDRVLGTRAESRRRQQRSRRNGNAAHFLRKQAPRAPLFFRTASVPLARRRASSRATPPACYRSGCPASAGRDARIPALPKARRPLRPFGRTGAARSGKRRKLAARGFHRQQFFDAPVAIDHRRLVLEQATGIRGRAVGRVQRLA